MDDGRAFCFACTSCVQKVFCSFFLYRVLFGSKQRRSLKQREKENPQDNRTHPLFSPSIGVSSTVNRTHTCTAVTTTRDTVHDARTINTALGQLHTDKMPTLLRDENNTRNSIGLLPHASRVRAERRRCRCA